MQIITPDNDTEAQLALREILMLYVNLAEEFSGFGHAVDANIRLDPLQFVDAEMETRGYAPWLDLALLRTGSAIAALCLLYDWWAEEQAVDNSQTQGIKQALAEGRFRHAPDVEAVIAEAFRRNVMPIEDTWFEDAVAPIYRTHVLGYFRRLSLCNRDGQGVT